MGCMFLLWTTTATAQTFSDSVQISLLTASPGADLYAAFGHSAIRVHDPATNKDWVFNYGTFDFDTPNFYMKFVRGQLNYTLSRGSLKGLQSGYQRSGQRLTEEVFLLTSEQRRQVLDFLLDNYRPENREYLYDFFFDNCATRIRDILEVVLGDALVYDPSGYEPLTFRQLLDLYLSDRPWMDFGMDVLVGLPADRIADIRGQMYLPDFLSLHLGQATVLQEQVPQPLTTPAAELVPLRVMPDQGLPIYVQPLAIGWFFFTLMLLMTLFAGERLQAVMDQFLYLLFGLAGCLLVFMWWGTDHPTTKENMNLLWVNPLLLVLFFSGFGRGRLFGKVFCLVLIVVYLAFLAGYCWWPQQFPVGTFPIALGLCLRLLDRFFMLRKIRIKLKQA